MPGHSDYNWKVQRREVTLFWGYITFILTLLFILVLPSYNRISNYIYYKFLKFNRSTLNFNLKNQFWSKINPMAAQMVIFWSILLFFLSTIQTEWDLRFLAARLGRVPVYCLPTVLFLTLRPSPLNEVLYLTLLPIHKWLSRLVILQSLLHTLCYIYLMFQQNTFFKLKRFDNINGIIAMTAFLFIFVTSLPIVRRLYFKFFFLNHYICTWVVTITLYFHVRPSIPYLTMLNCFILIYQIYYRFRISKISKINTFKISNKMMILDLPNDSIAIKNVLPGCHVRLIDFDEKRNAFFQYLRNIFFPIQHPYTLATLPVDKSQKLIIRLGSYKFDDSKTYLITGSYEPHLSFLSKIKSPRSNSGTLSSMLNNSSQNPLSVNTNVKKCLIVVGGSAISFALPILRVLNYNGCMVKIIWVIRDHEDLKILDYFKNYLINDDCIDIFITGTYTLLEKKHFKDALNELHNKKVQLQLKQESEILSGNYSYNTQNATGTAENISPEPSDFIESSLHTSMSLPKDLTIFENNPQNETSPLLDSSFSYGSVKNPSHPKHRKSYIDFRSHIDRERSDSYNEETIDVELNEKDSYNMRLPFIPSKLLTPSAGVGNSNNSNPSHQGQTRKNDGIVKAKSLKYIPPTAIAAENASISQLLKSSRESTSASSALYDDLENYWILKDSFCKIEFGRPKLGLYYYSWCIGSSCIGPVIDLETGESICYNDQSASVKIVPNSLFNEFSNNELYSNDQFMANKRKRLIHNNDEPDDTIWVIGAGPTGLVDNVRLWANDCGFSFHEESFIV